MGLTVDIGYGSGEINILHIYYYTREMPLWQGRGISQLCLVFVLNLVGGGLNGTVVILGREGLIYGTNVRVSAVGLGDV